ncbi:MAG: MFS transporter [Chloroflexi bacterium]|nr:MFS transporter [Chloroflexota bacterium]
MGEIRDKDVTPYDTRPAIHDMLKRHNLLPSRHNRPHYAWIILASTTLMFAISSGAIFSFGVLVDPLVEQYGWSRGAISFAYTLQFLVGIPLVLVAGRLAESIGSRRIVMASAIIFTIGMLLNATVTRIWQFQLYFGVLINGISSSVFITLLPVIITRWFNQRLGLAMGLMWTGLSLGPAVFSPLLSWSIQTAGWSSTFVIFGLISGALMLGSASLLRDHPGQKGLSPFGGLPAETPSSVPGHPTAAPVLTSILTMSSFWSLTIVHALGCVGHSIPMAHVVSIAIFAGIPSIPAAGILSMISAASVISRLGMSLLAQAKGGRFTLAVTLLLQTLPMLFLLNASHLASFYAFAFIFAQGYGGEMVGFPIYNRQYYGTRAPLNTIYAYQIAGAMLGMAAGGWLGGAIFDWTGTYTWAILAAMIAGSLGVAAAMTLPAHRRHPG